MWGTRELSTTSEDKAIGMSARGGHRRERRVGERRRRSRDLSLLLRHVRRDVGEQRRAEIALARVGEHRQDPRALRRILAHLERRLERRARGHTDEDAL